MTGRVNIYIKKIEIYPIHNGTENGSVLLILDITEEQNIKKTA